MPASKIHLIVTMSTLEIIFFVISWLDIVSGIASQNNIGEARVLFNWVKRVNNSSVIIGVLIAQSGTPFPENLAASPERILFLLE